MWDERYQGEEYVYGTAPNAFLAEVGPTLPGAGQALCLAAGEGRNAVYLAELGYEVTAMDASQVGLDKAAALAARRGVSISCVQAKLQDFSLGASDWDVITAFFCHLPPPLRVKVFGQIPAALRPGGRFLLEGYTVEQLSLKTGGPSNPEWMYDEASLRADLEGLRFEHLKALRRDMSEGRGHVGEGAVLQAVAVRP